MNTGRLLILVGVSGSGKSTFAHEVWADAPNITTIVNRDKIRELLFGFTEEGITKYYTRNDLRDREKQVTRYEDTLINEGLRKGHLVIVDATHLSRKYIERFKYWNVPTELKVFDITLGGAIGRDANRNRRVGDAVINKQFNSFKGLIKNLEKDPIDFTPFVLDNPVDKPLAVVVDVDGTLAEKGDRNPYDWKKVGEDSLINSVAHLVDCVYNHNAAVIIATGRDEKCINETKAWLADHEVPYDKILIRKEDDMRPDWVVKREMAEEICKDYHIFYWVDDRLQVTRYLRNIGIKVFNVEYNNF